MPYLDKEKQKGYQKEWNHNADNIKSKELGISFGTACHRLRKKILFKYLKKAGENFCYDCKKEILTSEELSIQHKKVWLHINPELFWDLDNIAFSHRKCNKTERPYRKGQVAPHGTITRYGRHRCRCEKCKVAGKIVKRKWRKARLL